jgi:hypothetical protein
VLTLPLVNAPAPDYNQASLHGRRIRPNRNQRVTPYRLNNSPGKLQIEIRR